MISWNDSNYFIIRNLIIKVPSKRMVFRCISDRDAHRFPPKPNRFYTFILHLVFLYQKKSTKEIYFLACMKDRTQRKSKIFWAKHTTKRHDRNRV